LTFALRGGLGFWLRFKSAWTCGEEDDDDKVDGGSIKEEVLASGICCEPSGGLGLNVASSRTSLLKMGPLCYQIKQ